jgi:hypothetical protein
MYSQQKSNLRLVVIMCDFFFGLYTYFTVCGAQATAHPIFWEQWRMNTVIGEAPTSSSKP